MGWFRRKTEPNEELENIQLALVALRVELDRERAEGAATRERLQELETKAAETNVPEFQPAVADPTSWASPEPELSLADVRRRAEQMGATTDAHSRELVDVHARLTAVDARLAELTDTITNQLSEIGQDIDRLQAAGDGRADETASQVTAELDPSVLDGRFDELRENQTRIANEQARFAKSLHEQLAALADDLRRTTR